MLPMAHYRGPVEAYGGVLQDYFRSRRRQHSNVLFGFAPEWNTPLWAMTKQALDWTYPERFQKVRGRLLPYSQAVVQNIFPLDLYLKHGLDLRAMLADPLMQWQGYGPAHRRATYVSRLEAWFAVPQLTYVLDRFNRFPNDKVYMLSTYDPGWVYDELHRHPSQPKSSRITMTFCLSNVDFRSDAAGRFQTNVVCRNIRADILIGDLVGIYLLHRAMARALGREPGIVTFYCLGLDLAGANKILHGLEMAGAHREP